jgi:biopolymer transport protein ExbD
MPHNPTIFTVAIRADGMILFNGRRISDNLFRKNMSLANSLTPEPMVILETPSPAPCDRVEAVRAMIDTGPLCHGSTAQCAEGKD